MDFLIPIGVFLMCLAAAMLFAVTAKTVLSVGNDVKEILRDRVSPLVKDANKTVNAATDDLIGAKSVIENVENVTGKVSSAVDKVSEVAAMPGKIAKDVVEKLKKETDSGI